MSGEQISVMALDTYLLRGRPLIRIDPGAYPFDWHRFVDRVQYATMAEQHEGRGFRWLAEMIPVSLADDVWTVITHRRLRRLYSQGEPCGVIERIEISMADDDRVIVVAVPAGPGTIDQEIRIYASRPGADQRADVRAICGRPQPLIAAAPPNLRQVRNRIPANLSRRSAGRHQAPQSDRSGS